MLVGQHDADHAGGREFRRPQRKHLEELHQVEVVNERVGDLDEYCREPLR